MVRKRTAPRVEDGLDIGALVTLVVLEDGVCQMEEDTAAVVPVRLTLYSSLISGGP